MSWFSTNNYSTNEHYLSTHEIESLVSTSQIKSLDQTEEKLVEELLEVRRGGDGKISLSQINSVLLKLKNQNKISKYDKEGLMKLFESHFGNLKK